jgi:hypothetical protein
LVIHQYNIWIEFLTIIVQNCNYVVLLRFKDNKLFLNHSLKTARTLFNLLANSVGLGLVIIKLVLSAYSTNLALLDVTIGKSLYLIKRTQGQELNLVVHHA